MPSSSSGFARALGRYLPQCFPNRSCLIDDLFATIQQLLDKPIMV
jgi:hypothetical protein